MLNISSEYIRPDNNVIDIYYVIIIFVLQR